MLRINARQTLRSWVAPNAIQAAWQVEYLRHLDDHENALWRSCAAGHLTGSALVTNPSRTAIVLVLHPRLNRWIQPGGHCEITDDSLAAVALREATEETGLPSLVVDPNPIDLDIHVFECPKGTPNRHLDVRFVVTAPDGSVPVVSDESHDVRWFPLDALPPDLDAGMLRLVNQLRV